MILTNAINLSNLVLVGILLYNKHRIFEVVLGVLMSAVPAVSLPEPSAL